MKVRIGIGYLVICAILTVSCTSVPKDKSPTLKSLDKSSVKIDRDAPVKGDVGKAKENYENLLKDVQDEALRKQAMRRLADLEMKAGEELPQHDTSVASAEDARDPAAGTDFKKAIDLYQGLLKSYPNSPDNDRILYQLAKAYENVGEIDKSLQTLNTLVKKYPASRYIEEAQFRRGELLFSRRDYPAAEEAYGAVVKGGKKSVFYERAIYKYGWSQYKQEKYAESLKAFFAMLDNKLANQRLPGDLAQLTGLSRGDRELINDTLRVVSLAFSRLEGKDVIAKYFPKGEQSNFEFLVYKGVGEFYLQQERYTDAAETFSSFGKHRPEHPQALMLHLRAIDIYKERGFSNLVLTSKKELAARYQAYNEYWATNTHHGFREYLIRATDAETKEIDTYVANTMEELGRYYHAQAQKNKNVVDYQEAAKWYRTFLRNFMQHPKAPEINFLSAEMLYEDKRYAEAIREYEKTAYNYTRHKTSAEAGYAALLAYEEYKKVLQGEEKDFWTKLSIQSAERFSKLFPKDKRTPAVLLKVVNELFDNKQYAQASVFAKRLLQTAPETDVASRRKAMVIIAQSDFEAGDYARAEKAYSDILQLTPANDSSYKEISDRVAASIYKQGEKLKEAGDLAGSTSQFLRVAKVVAASEIRATATYDAAANLIAMKNWPQAVQVLESFQRDFPNHKLQQDVMDKLAVAYLESGNNVKAAEQLEKIARAKPDPNFNRDATLQAAELYEKGGDLSRATEAYKRYVQLEANTSAQGIEIRQKIATLYDKQGQKSSQQYWLKQIVDVVAANAAANDRMRVLAANAALVLAEPTYEEFAQVKLVEPLKANIAKKKEALEKGLKSYNRAAEFKIAEVTTAATYRIAQMYNQFSRALMESERPKGLSPEALEQYELVLEEQAFPFEEKSIELYEANVQRISTGIYDDWVKKSLADLASLLPARYGKTEKSEPSVDVTF